MIRGLVSLKILSKQFFSNYVFYPKAKELSAEDQRKALISSMFLGIFTFGICHLVCLIKYRNQTFKLAAEGDPVIQKVQIVSALHVNDIENPKATQGIATECSKNDSQATKASQNEPKVSSFLIKSTDPDSTVQEAAKNASDPEEETLDALIKFAKKEEGAFLIDFSKVNPSNIFKIFKKGSFRSYDPRDIAIGDVAISDEMDYVPGSAQDESDKFKQNFSFKYLISIATEEGKDGPSWYIYMFTMSDEGKVESYGKVFGNFNEYIEYRMNSIYSMNSTDDPYKCMFKHFDFHSLLTSAGCRLRKKSSATDSH